jgi:uncharacterized protein (DUF736 family)
MTQQYSNENRGSLFKNEKKTEDKHPDLGGTLNVDGTDYWISGWTKVSKGGQKFISLSIRPKQDQTRQSSQPTRKAAAPAQDLPDDDLPW